MAAVRRGSARAKEKLPSRPGLRADRLAVAIPLNFLTYFDLAIAKRQASCIIYFFVRDDSGSKPLKNRIGRNEDETKNDCTVGSVEHDGPGSRRLREQRSCKDGRARGGNSQVRHTQAGSAAFRQER